MANPSFVAEALPVDLGDGLVLRFGTQQDAHALADFNARIQSDVGPDKPDERVGAWTYDLMAKPHPTFKPEYCTVVEDTSSGKILSTMNIIPQIWTYAGIPFKVGRPELVSTLVEYRNRGLVRKQFEVIHRLSAEHGEIVQAITGIPYYYRIFGYEMAMNLGGGRAGYPLHIPRLKSGETEPYIIRPAAEADIPLISKLCALSDARSLVACVRDEALWRYELYGKSEKNVNREDIRIIETQDGRPCGIFAHPPYNWGEMMVLLWYEILPEFSWLEITPTVIRYLEWAHAQLPPAHDEKKPFGSFGFWLGEDHPVYHVIPDSLPRIRKPYAWYLRLVDVPGFVNLISPVLEKRLANSSLAGYNGELKITFYRNGVQIVLEKGRLEKVEGYKPFPYGHEGSAGFPPHTFLQLLFGYRSMDMLKASFADVWTNKDEYHVLLDALFPRQLSDFWPVS
jgi:Acetyltransferase (GNAT) domain